MPGNVTFFYERNFLVYRTRINIKKQHQIGFRLFTHQGLYLLGTYNLRNNTEMFGMTLEQSHGNGNGNFGILMMIIKTITDNGDAYGNVMSEREFLLFLQMLKKAGMTED